MNIFKKISAVIRLLKRPDGISRVRIKLVERRNTLRWNFFNAVTLGYAETHPAHLALSPQQMIEEKSFNERHAGKRRSYKDTIKIAWFIPPYGEGGGGHNTIFRCQKFLKEDFGIESGNLIYGAADHGLDRDAYLKYLHLKTKTYYKNTYSDSPFILDPNELKEYQVHMATAWSTAYALLSAQNPLLRSYFIQDYEPSFYADGAKKIFSEKTYEFGFYPICAGPWLPQKIGYLPGMKRETDYTTFQLGVDKTHHRSGEALDERRGVCFYVRSSTERRGFELTLACIEVLKTKHPDIPLFTVGMESRHLAILQGVHHHGVCTSAELKQVFYQHKVYAIFSFTNYSLMPAEIIACGGIALDLDLPNNQAVKGYFDKEMYQLCEPNPVEVADKIAELVRKPVASRRASEMKVPSWRDEYAMVGNAILKQFDRQHS